VRDLLRKMPVRMGRKAEEVGELPNSTARLILGKKSKGKKVG
jgi:hypothetical protein